MLGLDSNLCREDLEDGQKLSSFSCIEKKPPWLFFSTLKFLLTKRQPETQLWHQPSRSPALPRRTQGSISFLHGLQECVPGASWVIQGGFYFTRVEVWEWSRKECGTFSELPPCSVLTEIVLFHPDNNPGRWVLLFPIYRQGNRAHSGMDANTLSTAIWPRSSQK